MKNNQFLYILLLLFVFFPITGNGQRTINYRITGIITDALSNEPIQATIIFQTLPDISEVYIDESNDSTGIYAVGLHTKNSYLVEVSAPLYKPEIDTLRVENSKDSINYRLLSVKPGNVLRLQRIYFAQGDFHIQPNSYAELNELLLLLERYPKMVIRLEGHTDRLGGRQANMILSQNRVDEIRKFLVRYGINEKRIKTQAFGGNRPISTENSEESRGLNRRVEVRILSI